MNSDRGDTPWAAAGEAAGALAASGVSQGPLRGSMIGVSAMVAFRSAP
jgi:hypothetical protein